jgi:hypothetical protein
MNERCPHCGAIKRKSLRDRLPRISGRTKIAVTFLAILYCTSWGVTQLIGVAQVKSSITAQGSTIGNFAYSPLPFIVRIDETYLNPLVPQMQRADMRYGWFFGRITELGASYVSSPGDPHFAAL